MKAAPEQRHKNIAAAARHNEKTREREIRTIPRHKNTWQGRRQPDAPKPESPRLAGTFTLPQSNSGEKTYNLYCPGHTFFLSNTTYIGTWDLTFVPFYSSISFTKIIFVTCAGKEFFREHAWDQKLHEWPIQQAEIKRETLESDYRRHTGDLITISPRG